jgi:hypothetical protein
MALETVRKPETEGECDWQMAARHVRREAHSCQLIERQRELGLSALDAEQTLGGVLEYAEDIRGAAGWPLQIQSGPPLIWAGATARLYGFFEIPRGKQDPHR